LLARAGSIGPVDAAGFPANYQTFSCFAFILAKAAQILA
jgi:hypothetical protein